MSEILLGIDVGPESSAYCVLRGLEIGKHGWVKNPVMLGLLRSCEIAGHVYVLESPQPQDRPLGSQLRDTIFWAGRFFEVIDGHGIACAEADERDVALWLTGNRSANNAALLEFLKDEFGHGRQVPCVQCRASGQVPGKRALKKCPACKGQKYTTAPGPLVGLNEHERSALGAALWYRRREEHRSVIDRNKRTNRHA